MLLTPLGSRPAKPPHGQGGFTLIEVMVALVIMAFLIGSVAALVGGSVRSKMIVAMRSADTETARQTLEWMSERLRNAGLNIDPDLQPALCDDMVVAGIPSLRPTGSQVYVAGEILNTNVVAGDEVVALGFRLSGGLVVEERSGCAVWLPTAAVLSNPAVTVTALSLRYFERNGAEVTVPTTDEDAIRSIRIIQITLTVQAQEGSSGTQTQTFQRLVMLRNPRPDISNWLAPLETNP